MTVPEYDAGPGRSTLGDFENAGLGRFALVGFDCLGSVSAHLATVAWA
jgi:hypothetical protein